MKRLICLVGIAFTAVVVSMVVMGLCMAAWSMISDERPRFPGD
jgi:hypothetical protein